MNVLKADAMKGVPEAEVNAIECVTEPKTPNIDELNIDTNNMTTTRAADHYQQQMASVSVSG